MKEIGTVVEVKNNMATVKFSQSPACSGCAMGCAAKGKERFVDAYDRAGVRPGEVVEVEFEERKALLGSVITYLIPLGFFLIGYATGSFLGSYLSFNSENAGVLFAFLFLALSFPFIKFLFRKSLIKEETFIPVITKKYPDHESSGSNC